MCLSACLDHRHHCLQVMESHQRAVDLNSRLAVVKVIRKDELEQRHQTLRTSGHTSVFLQCLKKSASHKL